MSSRTLKLRMLGSPAEVEAALARLQTLGVQPVEDEQAPVLFVGPASEAPVRGGVPLAILAPTFGEEEALRLSDGAVDDVLTPALSDAELVARLCRMESRGRRALMTEWHGLIHRLSDGAAVLDREARVVLLNPAGAEILGASTERVEGQGFLSLASPVEPVTAGVLLKAIQSGGRVIEADLEVTLPRRGRRVLAIGAGQLDDGTGRAVLTFRDVTEQRAAVAELRRTRDFLGCLLDSSSDAVIAADLKGRLVVFNRGAELLFGMPATEAKKSLSVVDLYPAGGAKQIMRLLRESPRRQIDSVRTYGLNRTGELIPVELSAGLVMVDGREVASVGVLRDLRERVRVESELSRAHARLADAEKQAAVTALAGATAHELNQPLTVILGFVELLQRRADDSVRTPLEAIGRETERMVQIVRRIAKLTRVETVSYPGEKQIADLELSARPQIFGKP